LSKAGNECPFGGFGSAAGQISPKPKALLRGDCNMFLVAKTNKKPTKIGGLNHFDLFMFLKP
jgi:hypothetical protein